MSRTARPKGNLPAESTTFVGRRHELAEIRNKLGSARLVTLVGPGGVGKTRLANHIAVDLARGFRDGAWLVELAELDNPSLVANAVVAALGLRDQAAVEPTVLLESYLADKQVLLVIDNCEHLVAACARVIAKVLDVDSGVKVVATSREPLSIAGEHVVPVPPLRLPDAGEPLSQLRQNEAVALFAERGSAASGGFELGEDNKASVVELCRRLDGLPLALELAAVRTRGLSVAQILDRLNDRFELLTRGSRAALPRHQTLRTTIDWSFDLLEADERAVFRMLSVFAGTFDLEALGSLSSRTAMSKVRVVDVMTSLVEKSLVKKNERRQTARFQLHETIREYALLRLKEAGEETEVRERLAAYYISVCRPSVEEVRYRLVDWLDWMEDEIENVRSILKRAQDAGDFATGIALSGSIGWYWATRATTEGIRWLDFFLTHPSGNESDLALAYFIRGYLAIMQTNPLDAKPVLRLAVEAARNSGQPLLVVQSLTMLALASDMTGDHETATRIADQAWELAEKADDRVALVSATQAKGFNAFMEGDLDRVKSLYSSAANINREMGDDYMLQYCLVNLGFANLITGDSEGSAPLIAEGLRIARRIDDRAAQYYFLDAFAYRAAASGDARRAALLLGAAATVRSEMAGTVNALLAPLLAHAEETCKGALGESRFKAEFAAGAAMSRDAAAAFALDESEIATKPSPPEISPLAKRERDVASLVAEGLSNKQIGARLFISERTVETHVRSILNKLGFTTRAQIAGWVGASQFR